MEHIESAKTLVTREYIGSYVTQRMSYVQSRTRRIREHIQYIELWASRIYLGFVDLVVAPILLPARLYFFMIVFHNSLLYVSYRVRAEP